MATTWPGTVPLVWRWAAAVAFALAALLAVERWQDGSLSPGKRAPPGVALTGIASSHVDALARTDFVIANAKAQAAAAPDQWLLHETVARNYLERARLSGDYRDYAAAEAALGRAFAVAVPGTGPHLVRAQLDFGMHRLAAAERQLNTIGGYAIPSGPEERAEITAMRGDIALYRGDLPQALRLYDEADRLAPGTATFRRAIYASRTGDIAGAERYIDRTETEARLPPPQLRAFLELQRGILDLDHDRLDQAMSHFRRADRLFPGHWLVEEHIAEVLTRQGQLPEAERRYRDIVRRTGHPEFMDALADILRRTGRSREASRLTDRAWSVWRQRIAQFPEAAYGHAIDHCIGKGDWSCAVRLARLNHDARPYGDAKIALARALAGAGQSVEARALVRSVLATPWRTPELAELSAQLIR